MKSSTAASCLLFLALCAAMLISTTLTKKYKPCETAIVRDCNCNFQKYFQSIKTETISKDDYCTAFKNYAAELVNRKDENGRVCDGALINLDRYMIIQHMLVDQEADLCDYTAKPNNAYDNLVELLSGLKGYKGKVKKVDKHSAGDCGKKAHRECAFKQFPAKLRIKNMMTAVSTFVKCYELAATKTCKKEKLTKEFSNTLNRVAKMLLKIFKEDKLVC